MNGQSFDYLTHIRALEILRSTTHLSLTVKNNLMGIQKEKFILKLIKKTITFFKDSMKSLIQKNHPQGKNVTIYHFMNKKYGIN